MKTGFAGALTSENRNVKMPEETDGSGALAGDGAYYGGRIRRYTQSRWTDMVQVKHHERVPWER